MGRKSRHYRDESDPLLGFYHQTLAATSSIRNTRNPLYASSSPPPTFSSPPNPKAAEQQQDGDDNERIATASSMPLFSLSKASSSSSTSSFDNDYIQDGIITKNKPAYSNNKAPEKKKNVSFLGYHYRTNNDTVDTINEANIHEKDEDTNKQSTRHNDSKKKKKEEKKKNGYRVHRVSYTAQDHIQVMFRLYGSAFPSVFPFVLVNVGWTFIVYWLKHHTSWADWTFHSSIGHSFMGLLVSFLIVSRSQISYTRFMDYRKLLAKTYQSCREIVQYTTVYTMYTRTIEAKQWREQVCYQTILLLRVTMDALLWSSTERYQWEDEYYRYSIDRDCKSTRRGVTLNHSPSSFDGGEAMNSSDNTVNNYVFNGEDDDVSEHFFRFRNLTHGRRSNIDEHFRAPITSMHVLRTVIMEHPQYLGYKLAVNEYRDLLTFVSNFDKAFHGFRVLVFTPYPFPLVQMTRGFLFFWVYTLPLVLLVDYRLWSSLLIVILVTFGFVGIEYVSMALDDPFGDDTNDIDEHGMALLVYEDIYMALYRTDGPDAAYALREKVLERYKKGRALDCHREDLKGHIVWDATLGQQQSQVDWSQNPPPQIPVPSPSYQQSAQEPSQSLHRRPLPRPPLSGIGR